MAAIYRRGKRYWARAQRKGREYRILAMPDVKWGGKSGKGGRPKSP
jgi:hypothetical protein